MRFDNANIKLCVLNFLFARIWDQSIYIMCMCNLHPWNKDMNKVAWDTLNYSKIGTRNSFPWSKYTFEPFDWRASTQHLHVVCRFLGYHPWKIHFWGQHTYLSIHTGTLWYPAFTTWVILAQEISWCLSIYRYLGTRNSFLDLNKYYSILTSVQVAGSFCWRLIFVCINWIGYYSKKGFLIFTTGSLIGFTSGFKVVFTMGRGGYRGGGGNLPPWQIQGRA